MTEHTETVDDLVMRYIRESLDAGAGKFPQFDMDDLRRITDAVESRFTEDEFALLHVYQSIANEFAKGHRCGVCGRTTEQNAAINYDCAREC